MKHFILICLLLLLSQVTHAQENQFVDEPKYVLKFAPRIFNPRMGFEKVLDKKQSAGFDLRINFLWFPQAIRMEGYYRRYFKDNAPVGAYLQPKVALGYFNYGYFGQDNHGIQAGTGISFGGQFNIGRNNAMVDVYGGLQFIAPFYLSNLNNQSVYSNYDYNLYHYLLIAFPLEFGVRFGFMKTKKVPKAYPINPSFEY